MTVFGMVAAPDHIVEMHVSEAEIPSFTCPSCKQTSYSKHDAEHGYCGACHEFTGEPRVVTPDVAELRLQWQALADEPLSGLPPEALVASVRNLARELLARTA